MEKGLRSQRGRGRVLNPQSSVGFRESQGYHCHWALDWRRCGKYHATLAYVLKWNEHLFREMYQAHLNGRLDVDPSVGWYKSEIGSFNFFYMFPLAKKLKDCWVFGVSSDECLGYAEANLAEWDKKGESIIQEYLGHCQQQRAPDYKNAVNDQERRSEQSILRCQCNACNKGKCTLASLSSEPILHKTNNKNTTRTRTLLTTAVLS
jgi:hypothetical protein